MIFKFDYKGTEYHFDDEVMSIPEATMIKHQIGLVGIKFFEAARAMDPEALTMMLVLAMRRGGVEDATMDSVYPDDPNGYVNLIQSVDVANSENKLVPNREERRRTARNRKNGQNTAVTAGVAEGTAEVS